MTEDRRATLVRRSPSFPPLWVGAHIYSRNDVYMYTRAMCYIYTRVRARRARSREENGEMGRGWRAGWGGEKGGAAQRNHRWLPFITPRSKHGPESGPLGRLHEERWFARRGGPRCGWTARAEAAATRGKKKRGSERSERAPRRNRPGTREPLVQPAITRSIASRKRAFLEARDKRLPRYAAGNGG